jgi:long-chain acyl-CoA synthetase
MLPRGIAAIAEAEPYRVALIAAGGVTSYRSLDEGANRVAQWLAGRGIGHGDRVAVRMRNCPELFMVWNGCARLGALVVPVSYRLTAPEVAYIVGDSGAAVYGHDDLDTTVVPARARALRAAIAAQDESLWAGPPVLPAEEFRGTPVILMPYTSGTTGRPKGIRRAPPAPSREAPSWPVSEFWGFVSDDVHLLCGPAYHTAPGMYAQMQLVEGAMVVVMDRFDAAECLRLIEDHRVTTSHMVPANFIRILEVEWQQHDLSSVRKILHAAAPCPIAVKRRIMDVFPPGAIWEYYGASEGMATVISPDEWSSKPGSVGRAFPGVDIQILDESGLALPPGAVGLVYITSRMGHGFEYHNDTEKTRAAWRGDMFTVGDLGRLDEDGYLFLVDRRDDLVISGGVNIYPAEVEQCLAEHPDVVDAAVFGLSDDRMGQRVHAVVELRPGAVRDPAALLDHLRPILADYKHPRTFEFVDTLPREPNGKVLKRRLRERAVSQ